MKIDTGAYAYRQLYDSASALPSSKSTALPDAGNKDPEQERIQQEVQRLKATEEKVKAHESAHKAAGGSFTGAVSYHYTTGPDGKRYITGGEVSISMPQGATPDETIQNMETVKRAALAPSDPSPQDRAVAASAEAIEEKARLEKANKDTTKGGATGQTGSGVPQQVKNVSVYA